MKTKRYIFYALLILPVFLVLVAMPFLPNIVPVHFNESGKVNGYGSKYSLLILPVINILGGLFTKTMTYNNTKQKNNLNNSKVSIMLSIAVMVVFNMITILLLYKSYFITTGKTEPIKIDFNQFLFTALGITLVIIGNFMPKCRMNSYIGLRTKWSMKNEFVWSKCQRLGGTSFVISGILIIIGNLFFREFASFLYSFIILGIDMVVSFIGSYVYYKKYS